MNNKSYQKIRTALLSVYDKDNLINLAFYLQQNNVTILSTSGTGTLLSKHNIPFTEISQHTGSPEIMEGRVKTLHHTIYGGILGRRGIDDPVMEQHNMLPIDLVIVNLYPFETVINQDSCTMEQAIENIDIGGPAMIRASAKNYRYVTVITEPKDYETIQKELKDNECSISLKTRYAQAIKAFHLTANYDKKTETYLKQQHINLELDQEPPQKQDNSPLPDTLQPQLQKRLSLRYGENPHQQSALYSYNSNILTGNVADSKQIHGKKLSYNNIMDAETALECVKLFEQPACVIVKHANPCGVSEEKNILNAYKKAYSTDPISAFGGIIAFNKELDKETLTHILNQQFVELIITPHISQETIQILKEMDKPNIRILVCGNLQSEKKPELMLCSITNGMLAQERDFSLPSYQDLTVVTKNKPSHDILKDLYFAWKVCKFVKSNAIVFAKNLQTIGIGAGQTSRIHSTQIASQKAEEFKLSTSEAMMASDAFFPFPDNIEMAANIGIQGIIQPGGSVNDKIIIEAADRYNLTMVFTHMRHFRH